MMEVPGIRQTSYPRILGRVYVAEDMKVRTVSP